ncbi:hypothetical protein PSTT_00774 [Puccinia striiformis]|uniref:Uncharacterized protein n=1 Tax=Puccinia striiformis TaxID=27350 RepID=A0A2S4W5I5_9BASI|nr:hypothetical protein PSTT_00774 [Puccinia striiformis]
MHTAHSKTHSPPSNSLIMQHSNLSNISDGESEASSASSCVSYPDRSDFPDVLSESDIREVIASLVSQGQPGGEILRFLQQECGVSISLRTLNRRRAEWGLRNCDLPKRPLSSSLSPQIKASILSSHQQRFTVSQMRSRLTEDTGRDVCHRTIERYLACMDLKQRRNDIADGTVTRETAKCLIDHARTQLLAHSAGYRRMRQILIQEYQTHIPRLLFLFLWMPVFQMSVDRWVSIYNASRKRKDKRTELPTSCSPNFSYSTPAHFNSTNHIVNVPKEDIQFF